MKSLVERRDRILSDIESVQSEEAVSIALQNLLAVNILIGIVLLIIARVDSRQVLEVFFETVVFNDELSVASVVITMNKQEIDPVCRMRIGLIELTKVLANLELRDHFQPVSVFLPKGRLVKPIQDGWL